MEISDCAICSALFAHTTDVGFLCEKYLETKHRKVWQSPFSAALSRVLLQSVVPQARAIEIDIFQLSGLL